MKTNKINGVKKMKTGRNLLLLVLLGAMAGCFSSRLAYDPNPIDEQEARAIIEKVLRQQPGQYGPTELLLEEDRFEIKRNRRVPISIYYNDFSRGVLYKKGQSYRIKIVDKSNVTRIVIVTYSKDYARKFIDAMNAMSMRSAP